MNISQKEIDEYCKGNLEISKVRKYYIDICINRKEYDTAIALLKEGKEKVLEIVRDWKSRYKNRPAMMDELNKL